MDLSHYGLAWVAIHDVPPSDRPPVLRHHRWFCCGREYTIPIIHRVVRTAHLRRDAPLYKYAEVKFHFVSAENKHENFTLCALRKIHRKINIILLNIMTLFCAYSFMLMIIMTVRVVHIMNFDGHSGISEEYCNSFFREIDQIFSFYFLIRCWGRDALQRNVSIALPWLTQQFINQSCGE